MSDPKEVVKWYNKYSSRQQKIGLNLRHYTIINKCIDFGLSKNSTVLEIGCGVGTLTELLASFLTSGKLVAADISNESIEIAKNKLARFKNVSFEINDMQDFKSDQKFDFVILPDVMEHIPVDLHSGIFKTLNQVSHDKSLILINSPHPRNLDFMREFYPQKLQIIDQSLNASELISKAYNHGFELVLYDSYGLYINEHDYTFIAFRKALPVSSTNISKNKIIIKKLARRLSYFLNKL